MTADTLGWLFGALVTLLVGALLVHGWRRRRLELATQTQPFPDAWRAVLVATVPLYRRLPDELRSRVERAALTFLSRVEFRGCNGLQVTDEMRAIVAVQAALLLVNRNIDLYRRLRAVLLYPDVFIVPIEEQDEAGVVTEGKDVLSGQSIETDVIVLSWPDVLAPQDHNGGASGTNLVLHECAHFLDHVAGGTLSSRPGHHRSASNWHDVLETEYTRLCRAVDAGTPSLIDPYGSEDPTEFYAVATEAFFERSAALEEQNPELYGLLREFYALDPARWRTS
ncbi:MAG: zinc-dependent peptidase [Steroidobacteraceae bacterium]